MRDYLGWRKVFGVATPAINTCVQPEYDAMRPRGVTNQVSRIRGADIPLRSDADFEAVCMDLFSSLDDARDKVRGLEVGAVDFVSKPFQKDEVVARVNTHLTLQRLRRQLEARNAELSRELGLGQLLSGLKFTGRYRLDQLADASSASEPSD